VIFTASALATRMQTVQLSFWVVVDSVPSLEEVWGGVVTLSCGRWIDVHCVEMLHRKRPINSTYCR
jgi:hypothetical protein